MAFCILRRPGADFWLKFGDSDLQRTLLRLRRAGMSESAVAKNVVLFVGDGMGGQVRRSLHVFQVLGTSRGT